MKKILIASNFFLLLVIIAMIFYYNSKCCTTPVNLSGNQKITCADKLCKDYSSTDFTGILQSRFAKIIADNYKADNSRNKIWMSGARTDKDDATSVWFSLTTLKKYLWEVEKKNCEQNCNDSLGIRIYFAKYPEATNEFWDQTGMIAVRDEYANHHTVFMVPTYYLDGIHYDYDAFRGKCRVPLKSTIGSPVPVENILFGDQQNHGSLIPPRAADGSAF